MAFAPGVRVGPYEIQFLLGQGGMGEVYRARDSRLDRPVALKVLPSAFSADPERRSRFEREARTLAALNHSHIAQIYGLETFDGVHALAMELVEGEDLAARLSGGALPFEEARAIALQIADALQAAHEHGVIHRDLKPANIAVTPDGQVKVLDFGLAKLQPGTIVEDREPTTSPTITTPAMTHAGVILGTAAYMSPEQAKGRPLDKRTDVWSFGCVLYEMLTGRRAFAGEDVTDTLALVLRGEPEWREIPPEVPDHIRALVRGCLEKDRQRRVADLAVATFELRDVTPPAASQLDTQRPAASVETRRTGPAHAIRTNWPWAVAIIAMLVAGLTMWPREPAAVGLSPAIRFHVDVGALRVPQFAAAALSPDGSVVVFAASAGGSDQLYVRRLGAVDVTPLRGTEDASAPFFSPDGQWVGFFADGALKKSAVSGGATTTVLKNVRRAGGGAWGRDGFIVFASSDGGLARVSASGGQPVAVTSPTGGERIHRWPQLVDDGRALVFTTLRLTSGALVSEPVVVIQRLADGARKDLVPGASIGRVISTGHLVYQIDSTLFAVKFDLAQLATVGPAVRVFDGAFNSLSGSHQLEIAANGAALVGQGTSRVRRFSLIERDGRVLQLEAEQAQYWDPRLSPDGRRIAVSIESDLWIYEWERNARSRLTFDGLNNWDPVWSPDGAGVIFSKSAGPRAGMYWQRADGATDATALLTDIVVSAQSWHPSGRFVAANSSSSGQGDILVIPLDGDSRMGWRAGSPKPFVATRAHEMEPAFSPDGRWLAYQSNETGRFEVYVRPYPGPGGRWQISHTGGLTPTWAHDGRRLLYRTADGKITIVNFTTHGDAFTPGAAAWWSNELLAGTDVGQRNYDVHPDGRRILALQNVDGARDASQRLLYISQFGEEIRRALSASK